MNRLVVVALFVMAASACGRVGYDARAGSTHDGGEIDGARLDGSAGADGSAPGDGGGSTDGATSDGGAPTGPPTHQWSISMGSTGDETAWALEVDGAGNAYVAGMFSASIDFGDGARTSAGSTDAFVASFTQLGAFRWARTFGAASSDQALGVAVDPLGTTVVVVGEFEGMAGFGPSLVSAGADDAFVVALNGSNGSTRWAKRIGGTGDDGAWRPVIDGSRVLVGLAFSGNVTFGGGPVTSAGREDVALTALDAADGSIMWAQTFGSSASDLPYALATDAAGDIWLAGEASGPIDFGGGAVPNAGMADCFVAHLASDGSHRFSRSIGGAGDDGCEGLVLGPGGLVYLSGWYDGPMTVDGHDLPDGGGGTDGFVLALDASGAVTWALGFGARGSDDATDIDLGPSGGPVATGWFQNTVDLGTVRLQSAGSLDTFLAQLRSDGTVEWAIAIGAAPEETGSAVAWDGSGYVVWGGYDGATSLGGDPLPFRGVYDLFLTRFAYGS